MVKTGGYQSGRSYRWYREMGHNPLSAWHMRWSTVILFVAIGLGAAATGVLWGLLLTGRI